MDLQVFTTEKIAKILGLPEWRVVRFAQMKGYGIRPAFGEAEGSGSRRLYSLENVCEMALASWLVEAGFRVELIGRVLKRVRGQGGLSHLWKKTSLDVYLGILRAPAGKITKQEAVFIQSWEHLENMFEQHWDGSVLVIPVGRRFQLLARRVIEKKDGE